MDFTRVVQTDMSANVNSNCVRVEVAQVAMDVKRGVELVQDASAYGVGEVDMSGGGDS